MNRTLSAVALLALVSGCDTFSASHAYCDHFDQCQQELDVEGDNDDSDDGSDDVAVCTQATQALIDAYNANSEPECKEYASAYDAALRCVATVSCDDLAEGDTDECDDEEKALDKISENISDDEIDCESLSF